MNSDINLKKINNENRKMKIKSIKMNRFHFYFYVILYNLIKKIKISWKNRKEIQFENRWVYFSPFYHTFSLSYTEASYDSRPKLSISLGFYLLFYISQKRAIYEKYTYDHNQGDREYGIKMHNNIFWVYNGLKTNAFEFPHTYRFIRHSTLRIDGKWEHDYSKLGRKVNRVKKNRDYIEHAMKDGSVTKDYSKNFYDNNRWKNILYIEDFDYTYILENGTIQKRIATIKVEEREWRRYFLVWTPWKAKISKYIEITFDKEVGERSGSYKGGVTGTSYNMLPDESAEQCLRRFEKNRKL